jgi:hypothetical protein
MGVPRRPNLDAARPGEDAFDQLGGDAPKHQPRVCEASHFHVANVLEDATVQKSVDLFGVQVKAHQIAG